MSWVANPEAVLSAVGGALELADNGDPEIATEVLRRLAELGRAGTARRMRLA